MNPRPPRLVAATLLPLVLITASCSQASEEDSTVRDEDGQVVESGSIGVFRLQMGDCIVLPSQLGSIASTEVEEIEDFQAVPCDELHEGEVVLVDKEFFADLEAFPGVEAGVEQGALACLNALDEYTSTEWETSGFDVLPLVPTEPSWDTLDDRSLTCIGVTLNDAMNGSIDTTGSMRSSG